MEGESKTALTNPDNGTLAAAQILVAMLPAEQWQAKLNTPPDPSVFKSRSVGGSTLKYIPISHIEALLDTLFFGIYCTENFKYTVIGNEVTGQIDLKVFHPIMKIWITRTGAAAAQIRQSKGAAITDINSKLKSALEADLPHLKSDCIKNAAKSLGKSFGRDLGRKSDEQGKPSRMVDKMVKNAKKGQE